uniref:Uncharacterized protein n=1 Tax=Rhizophora mucronata TaxID=61149 RepID=A0A2P2Q0R7_RHIMU
MTYENPGEDTKINLILH